MTGADEIRSTEGEKAAEEKASAGKCVQCLGKAVNKAEKTSAPEAPGFPGK